MKKNEILIMKKTYTDMKKKETTAFSLHRYSGTQRKSAWSNLDNLDQRLGRQSQWFLATKYHPLWASCVWHLPWVSTKIPQWGWGTVNKTKVQNFRVLFFNCLHHFWCLVDSSIVHNFFLIIAKFAFFGCNHCLWSSKADVDHTFTSDCFQNRHVNATGPRNQRLGWSTSTRTTKVTLDVHVETTFINEDSFVVVHAIGLDFMRLINTGGDRSVRVAVFTLFSSFSHTDEIIDLFLYPFYHSYPANPGGTGSWFRW